MTTLLIATRNPGKLTEMDRIVRAAGITGLELLSLHDVTPFDEAPETAPDFAGNALAKAQDACAATGLPSIADDSGLAIDALNGMPGVLSARWSGSHGQDEANVNLVLAQLRDVQEERMGAAFCCAAALVLPEGEPTVVHGEWRGRIVREPRGANGFGYDPIFEPAEEPGHTSAELDPARKDALSHRAKAMAALIPALRTLT